MFSQRTLGIEYLPHTLALVSDPGTLAGSVRVLAGQGTHAVCFCRPSLYVSASHAAAEGPEGLDM
jgi:hypothetical protein